jgi:hypothetical protein
MKLLMNKNPLEISLLPIVVAFSLVLVLSSCASQATSETPAQDAADTSTKSSEAVPAVQPVGEANGETGVAQAEQSISANTAPSVQTEMAELGESCKQQSYVNYEKQAREHIQHGWEATQAQRFGVGFRDTAEYEKWSEIHKKLFAKVSDSCGQLSNCVKQNPADKEQKCAAEAKRFEQWQSQAKRFADKVKIVESSQPPMLCSLTPSAQDPSQCFALVADQIEQTCQTAACKEAAGCFRGVSFLNDAINQAKLACGFVGQELSQCRGYVEATGRRKAELEQCLDMYSQLQVEILPVF